MVFGLFVVDKFDFNDICFIFDGDIFGWLLEKIGLVDGEICDEFGVFVGYYNGYYYFIIG